MSYILKKSEPIINVKLTETGRRKLASGLLNFSSWGVGDSEIDYGYMTPNTPGVDAKILRPKDRNPNIKTYLKNVNGDFLQSIGGGELSLLGITVNNRATERGFFGSTSGVTTGYTVYTSTTYVTTTGFVDMSLFTGGYTIDLGISGLTNCELIQFAYTNPVLGELTPNVTDQGTPWLWYKVQGQTGTTIQVDRNLPNINGFYTGSTGLNVQYFVYSNCNDTNGCYGSGCTTSYWNTGTLEFNSNCDISITDVPIWCQNNVWCEELIGLSGGTYQGYESFGSMDYIGQKQYLGYDCECTPSGTSINICGDQVSIDDDVVRSIGILHYTNNTISNFYGEFFYIDTTTDKLLQVDFPTVMWYRRSGFSGSTTGTYMGMSFVSSGDVKTVINSDIEYYDLIEKPSMTIYPTNPLVVGRVYPQLKVVTIHDPELLTALSYKSNRNWTLPKLKCNLSNPATGTGTGVLEPNQTMFLTYELDTDSGFTSTLPCQKYIKIVNTSTSSKDVQFTLEDIGLLPYMKQVESVNYDGRGFYAHNFNLLSQIVDDTDCRPSPTNWKKITWGGISGQTINPLTLEDQNPVINDFTVTRDRYTGATNFDLSYLGLPTIGETGVLNFGDERFMYGNLNTWIGAKIFKTVFNLTVNGSYLTTTDNKTKNSATNLYFDEVGIYDNVGDLVIIGKFSTPIELPTGITVGLELTLDF
jgi:hypothetical protein